MSKTNGQTLYELWHAGNHAIPTPWDELPDHRKAQQEAIAQAFLDTFPNPFRSPGLCDQPTGRQTLPDSDGWWWFSVQDDPVKVLTKQRSWGGRSIAWVNNSIGYNTWVPVDELKPGWWEKMEKPK